MKKLLLLCFTVSLLLSCSNNLTELETSDSTLRSTNSRIHTDWSGLLEVVIVEKSVSGYQNQVRIDVPADYVVVGGGASISNSGNWGALLTGSYPNLDLTGWNASSKDHNKVQYHTLTSYAIGLKVKGLSRSELRSHILIGTSTTKGGNGSEIISNVNISDEYKVIGGGANITGLIGRGVMLKASIQNGNGSGTTFYPINGWKSKARDHMDKSSATLTTYVIGIKPNLPIVGEIDIERSYISQTSSRYVNKFIVHCYTPYNSVLTCGGGETYGSTTGRFLYSLNPTLSSFSVTSIDHIKKDDSMLTESLAISMKKKNN